MKKTVVITQSNYLPWRGSFDLFRRADEVILLDSVQYTRRDWRNRNLIKTANGPTWLTVPVEVKGRYSQAIDETRVMKSDWAKTHRRTIEHAYRRAACFESEAPFIFDLLERVAHEPSLSTLNSLTLRALCDRLGIKTLLRHCTDLLDQYQLQAMKPTDRLVALCLAAGASQYVSGPAARAYLDEEAFSAAGIDVGWMSYEGYRDYPQVGDEFEPRISVIDLLLNTGPEASEFLNSPVVDEALGAASPAMSACELADPR